MSFIELFFHMAWPPIVAALIATPATLIFYEMCKRAWRARVRRAELREYRRLSAIYGGTARR